MAEMFNQYAYWILKHVPMITTVGLGMAGALWVIYIAKRTKECALLAGVCAAYAVTPYLPHMSF